MSFLIFALVLMLVFMSLGKFRNLFEVAGAFALIFGLTALFYFYGSFSMGGGDSFILLGSEIDRSPFYHLTGVWIVINFVTAFFIVRNYRRYLDVNNAIKARVSGRE